MTIIDSSINLYNYNLVYFILNAGSIACLLCFIVTTVMTVWDVDNAADNAAANVMPAFIGLLILCIAVIIAKPLSESNKNTTCYKVVLEPSFTEEEFNTITTGFVIDSYEDGFWLLEELNPNNEAQKPNTQQERHRFYLIYSGDEGGMEDLENSATEAKDKSEPITSAEEPAKIEPITSTEEPAKSEPITSTEEHDKLEPSASTEVNFYSILQEANQGKDKEINTLYEILNKPFQVIRENQR